MSYNLTTRSEAELQRYAAANASRVSAITNIANQEIANIGAHAVSAMAQVTSAANDVQRRLTYSGRSAVFDDASDKVLQVTGQNLITLANTAQREILAQAASLIK